MQAVADLIYVWGMGAAVVLMPTILVIMWGLSRTQAGGK